MPEILGEYKSLFELKTQAVLESFDFNKDKINRRLGEIQTLLKNWKIGIVGSWLLGTTDQPVIDMSIEMPATLFQKKDVKNFKYFAIRHKFLLEIAELLQKYSPVRALCDGNPLRSYLRISFKKFSIKLIPTSDFIALDRLSPAVCNISKPTAGMDSTLLLTDPTPYYNASILQDSCQIKHLNLLHSQLQSPHFKNSCVLLKVWLNQRLDDAPTFVVIMILDYLLRYKIIQKYATPLQMLRGFFSFISTFDFDLVLLLDQEKGTGNQTLIDSEWNAFDVAVVHAGINLTSFITKSTMHHVFLFD